MPVHLVVWEKILVVMKKEICTSNKPEKTMVLDGGFDDVQ